MLAEVSTEEEVAYLLQRDAVPLSGMHRTLEWQALADADAGTQDSAEHVDIRNDAEPLDDSNRALCRRGR